MNDNLLKLILQNSPYTDTEKATLKELFAKNDSAVNEACNKFLQTKNSLQLDSDLKEILSKANNRGVKITPPPQKPGFSASLLQQGENKSSIFGIFPSYPTIFSNLNLGSGGILGYLLPLTPKHQMNQTSKVLGCLGIQEVSGFLRIL